jgi:pyruvate dehydrogenase kinase 2/3/4
MRSCEHFPYAPVLDHVLVDEFLRQRLGIQLLCDHYISLNKGKSSGVISLNCVFHDVLTDAILESKHICDANFGIAPNVYISNEDEISLIKMHLIRPWVHHAIVELLKNAMTSSIKKDPFNPPDIYVEVDKCHNSNTLKCKIIDQGEGLKSVSEAFRFASSSIEQIWDRLKEQQSYATVRPPIASLGVGLPLSSMMIKMFGGNIHLEQRSSGFQISDHLRKGDYLNSGVTAELQLPFSVDIEEWSSSYVK